jgi:hypothetical protein
MVADITNLTSGTLTSAIASDIALNNSTSTQQYFLRASVAPVGFVGPEVCNFIVQGANDTGSGSPTAAGATTNLSSWAQLSNVIQCPATATAQTVSATAASPAVFTPSVGGVPASGSIIMFTALGSAGAGIAVRTPYQVLQTSATTYQLTTALGGTTAVAISTTAMTNGTALVGTNATTLTPTALSGNAVLFSETVNVGDTVVFGNVGSITGLTAGTLYYVTTVTSAGATFATSSGGATITLGGSIGTPFAGKVNFTLLPAIFPASVASNVITTSVPHGLSVGQIVVPNATATGWTSGQAYYVNTTPSQTTFTVSATIGGATATITGGTPLFVGRAPKLVNPQVAISTRPWIRMALQQLNGAAVQDGYVAIYSADISMGRDSSQAL